MSRMRDDKRRTREDRATQPMDCWRLSLANTRKGNTKYTNTNEWREKICQLPQGATNNNFEFKFIFELNLDCGQNLN